MSHPEKSALVTGGWQTFEQFYPFYLNEHRNRTCKVLHFIGTLLVMAITLNALVTGVFWKLWLLPVFGYGFAWVGHFVFEKNRPATFKAPFYSLRGDFVMFWHLLSGRLSFETNASLKPKANS